MQGWERQLSDISFWIAVWLFIILIAMGLWGLRYEDSDNVAKTLIVCPYCGKKYEQGLYRCPNCGI